MCACTDTFVCSRCAGTPFDPAYMDSDPEPVSEEQFEDLTLDRHPPPIMFGSDA